MMQCGWQKESIKSVSDAELVRHLLSTAGISKEMFKLVESIKKRATKMKFKYDWDLYSDVIQVFGSHMTLSFRSIVNQVQKLHNVELLENEKHGLRIKIASTMTILEGDKKVTCVYARPRDTGYAQRVWSVAKFDGVGADDNTISA